MKLGRLQHVLTPAPLSPSSNSKQTLALNQRMLIVCVYVLVFVFVLQL
jgi:hypothetical protein